MDTDARTRPHHDPDPGRPPSARESSWADVEAAQADMQERLRPRWWLRLPELAAAAGVFTALLRPDGSGGLPFALLLLLPMLSATLRRAAPAPTATAPATWVFLAVVPLIAATALGAFGQEAEDAVRARPLIGGLLLGALFYGALLLAERRSARRLRRAGERLAAAGERGGTGRAATSHSLLRDPPVLGVMMRLSMAREIEVSALQHDLGVSTEQLDGLLGRLEDERLISVYTKSITGGRGSTWAALSPGGERELSRRLAVLARGAAR